MPWSWGRAPPALGRAAGSWAGWEAHSSWGSLVGLREGNPRRTEIAPKREEVSLFSVVGAVGHPQSCRGWRRKHWALGLGHKGTHNLRAGTRDPSPIPGVAPAWTQPSALPVSFQWEGVLSGPCMSAWQGSQEACDVPSFPVGLGPREALLVLGQWALEQGHGGCRVPTKTKSPVWVRTLGR